MGHFTGVYNFEHLDALVRLYRVAMGIYQLRCPSNSGGALCTAYRAGQPNRRN
jgi:hypothetical protein